MIIISNGQIWRDTDQRLERQRRPRYLRIVGINGSFLTAAECTADGVELKPCRRPIRADRFATKDYEFTGKVVKRD